MPKPPSLQKGKHRDFGERLQKALSASPKYTPTTTRNELGKKWGVAPSMVSDMLNGHKLPKMETGIKIALDLKIGVDWLYTGRGTIHQDAGEYLVIDHLSSSAQTTIKAVMDALEQQEAPKNLS